LAITLNTDESYGGYFKFIPPSFKDIRITEGDVYIFTYSFTSNADFDCFYFTDTTVEADNFRTPLSSTRSFILKIKANIEYNGMQTITITKTASSTELDANMIRLGSFINSITNLNFYQV
jgi:hypothetical protein